MKVRFKNFYVDSDHLTKEEKAAEFATEIGKERLINISSDSMRTMGVIIVWYWSEE